MNKATFQFFLLLFFCSSSYGQESLSELIYNSTLRNASLSLSETTKRSGPDTVSLPFLDDFSFTNNYPHDSLWLDNDVWINGNYPVNPPTIGVATFDGIDFKGDPYSPNQPNSYGIADYLTSKPIDLALLPADSIYFSFLYQPQGIGNSPEPADSLVLEFYSVSDTAWQWKWSVPGTTVQNFIQVMIPITDSVYLKKGFQFRFKNYSTLAGSFDHWHVDYVWLGKNRKISEPLPDVDVSFTSLSNSMLKNYRQMPWNQYKANPAAEMYDSLVVQLRNNSSQAKVVSYQYTIYDGVPTSNTSSGNVAALSNFSFRNKLNYTFPTASSAAYEVFVIENIISTPGDTLKNNDTIRFNQQFDQHYSYDDGSAEAGYGLNAFGAAMACGFTLNTSDQLTSIAIHFTQMNTIASIYPFKLTVWDNFNNKPGAVLYQEAEFSYPVYTGNINGFHIYQLTEPVNLSGKFYVGFVQNNDVNLNVGFDKNNNASANMFFNVVGNWSNSQFAGAWMIRPVFGAPGLPIAIEEENKESFSSVKVYPNPAQDVFYIDGINDWNNKTVALFDIYGKLVLEINEPLINAIQTSGFANGIYMLRITDVVKGSNCTRKIVVNR